MSDNNILGCFLSYPSLVYGASEDEKRIAKEQGDLFRSYIWGEKGLCDTLKSLKHEDYGKDLIMILFQFYVNPIPYEVANLKEIEPYRKKEKSVGIPIIATNENFFNKAEEGRYNFLKQSILQKLDLLAEVVKQKKLDTKIDLLKSDLQEIFCTIKNKK